MNKIHIYSVDINNRHNYEFSSFTELNARQLKMKFVVQNKLLNKVKETTRRTVYFSEQITDKSIFKAENVVRIYSIYSKD